VFVQDNRTGQATPVNVTAARLSYTDSERKARFDGGVVLKGADVSVTADRAEVRLQPRGQKSGAATASQVEEITAVGHIAIQQPSRKATGERLVYTAYDGKFVLTGGPPSIFDAEHGQISGDSLTFYSRDGRVLVGSRDSSRTVTHTRVDR
jgi:lipopolysaccharide export system protein LptA